MYELTACYIQPLGFHLKLRMKSRCYTPELSIDTLASIGLELVILIDFETDFDQCVTTVSEI